MAFQINPGFPNKRVVKPAISPLKPDTVLAPMKMDSGRSQNQAQIRMNVNANTNTENQSRSGGRIGGRNKTKRNQKSKTPAIPFPVRGNDNFSSNTKLTINQGDFGYDISGAGSPSNFVGSRDQTLFRDYNQISEIVIENTEGGTRELNSNLVTNSIKILETDLKHSLENSSAYEGAFDVIYNILYRDVTNSTKSASGALSAIEKTAITDYLHNILKGFDTLIELETMQAWSPSNTSEFDRCLRKIASLSSNTDILEVRSKLRQALIPHVLPIGWMNYIKWIRQTHTTGTANESTKLRFNSVGMVNLMNALFRGESIDNWIIDMNNITQAVQTSSARLPAVIMSNVTSIPFGNVKDHYSNVYVSANYDEEFCNIFNNRIARWNLSDGFAAQYPSINADHVAYAAFSSPNPYSLAVADLSKQGSRSGLPLEGDLLVTAVDDQTTKNSRFHVLEDNQGTFKIRGLERWYDYCDDSVHMVDLKSDGRPDSEISIPRSNETVMIVASRQNIRMAQREALNSMTMGG